MTRFSLLSLFALLFCLCQGVAAQSTYTEQLRKKQAGQGTIIINQDADIEKIVNAQSAPASPSHSTTTTGKPASTGSNKPASEPHNNATSSETHKIASSTAPTKRQYTGERTRHKARGYRICIFTGGNSRADKTKAYEMGNKCKNLFNELSVYPFFESPRWVCHVGDFKTREEAHRYVARIRRARISYEVRIVSSEVNVAY